MFIPIFNPLAVGNSFCHNDSWKHHDKNAIDSQMANRIMHATTCAVSNTSSCMHTGLGYWAGVASDFRHYGLQPYCSKSQISTWRDFCSTSFRHAFVSFDLHFFFFISFAHDVWTFGSPTYVLVCDFGPYGSWEP